MSEMRGISYAKYAQLENLGFTEPSRLPEDLVHVKLGGRFFRIPLAFILAWSSLVGCMNELVTPGSQMEAARASQEAGANRADIAATIEAIKSSAPDIVSATQTVAAAQGLADPYAPPAFVQEATLTPEPTLEPIEITVPPGTQVIPYGEEVRFPLDDGDGNGSVKCELAFKVDVDPNDPSGNATVVKNIKEVGWEELQTIGSGGGPIGAPLCNDPFGEHILRGVIYRNGTNGAVTLPNGAKIDIIQGNYVFVPVQPGQ
jgi:hypothetical protein